MQDKSTLVLLTCIKIPHGLEIFVLSIFECPLKTGFTERKRTKGFSHYVTHVQFQKKKATEDGEILSDSDEERERPKSKKRGRKSKAGSGSGSDDDDEEGGRKRKRGR